jgi:hypothetical protein
MSNRAREYLGSPVFTEEVPQLTSGELTIVDFARTASQSEKYAPFNFVTVTNNSSQAVKLYPNQNPNRFFTVAGNTIRSIDKKSIAGAFSFGIENAGSSTITAGDVVIEVQREVIDGETIIQKGANRLFGGWL